MGFLLMKSILGLDISSSTIGFSILEYDDSQIILKEYGHIKPPKKEGQSLSFRANEAMKILEDFFKKKSPEAVASENYATRFSQGRSTANTIIVLSVFNEITSISCMRALNIEPTKYAVISIRSKLSKFSGSPISSKEECFDFITKYFTSFKIRFKKTGKIKDECFDEADAIAVALTHIIKERENGKGPNLSKRGKTKTARGSKKTS